MKKKRREPKEPVVTLDGVPRMFGPHRLGTDEEAVAEWQAEVNAAADEMERAFSEMERNERVLREREEEG